MIHQELVLPCIASIGESENISFHFPVSRVVMDSSHHAFLFLETENRTEGVRFRSVVFA